MLATNTVFSTITRSIFGLVSFNDSSLCRLVEGGLTSISLGIDLIVRAAVAKLLAIVEEREDLTPTRQIVPCAMIVRGSSVRPEPAREEVAP